MGKFLLLVALAACYVFYSWVGDLRSVTNSAKPIARMQITGV